VQGQMEQFALGEKPYRGVYLTKNCTSAVPHSIFVEFEITIVPECICGLFINQKFKVLPVVVIPCVLALPSLCDCTFLFSAWPLNQKVHEA